MWGSRKNVVLGGGLQMVYFSLKCKDMWRRGGTGASKVNAPAPSGPAVIPETVGFQARRKGVEGETA